MRVSLVQTGIYNNYPKLQQINPNEPNNINFGLANAGKLKTLFTYGLPCMYSGVEMIDPIRVQRYLKSGVFNQSSDKVMAILKQYEKQITAPSQDEENRNIEAQVYRMLKRLSAQYPKYTLQQLLKLKVPQYKKLIRTEQDPVIDSLKLLSNELPEDIKYKFSHFLAETDDKLNDRPIELPFSSYEFRYKLDKIREDIRKNKNKKEIRLVNKMFNETSRLSLNTNDKTIEHQKTIINYLDKLLEKSSFKDNEELQELISTSKARLNKEKIKVPFKRKSFLYDLNNLIMKLPNQELKETLMQTARQLPTSSNSLFACVLKFASEPSDKIAYRLLWPYFASVEHILPKSKGGADDMANYGGATTKENTDRQNMEFTEQLIRRPKTPIFCQRYIDRLIELFDTGVFKSNNINPQYIEDFKSAVEVQAKGKFKLDTTNLHIPESVRKSEAIYNLLKTLRIILSNPERSK